MKSEFESREAFECIFGDEGEIDLSKDETGEYSFQPSRFAYSFFFLAWQYRQTDVDELELQVAEMKSRLNDAYTDGQSAMYTARQSKVDELTQQKLLQELEINQIAHANQQWQLKCDELQEKLDSSEKTRSTLYEENVDLRAKNDDLQKLVDAALIKLDKRWNESWSNWKENADMQEQGAANAFEEAYWLLEQALKGEQP